ncbi:MAG: hypothetical protein FWF22_03625 [Treponema sp.]|nr:hypothetical protein [Treponema sp.]
MSDSILENLLFLIPVVIILVIRFALTRKNEGTADTEEEKLHIGKNEESAVGTFTRSDIKPAPAVKTVKAPARKMAGNTFGQELAGPSYPEKLNNAAGVNAPGAVPGAEPKPHTGSFIAKLDHLPVYQKTFVLTEIFSAPKGSMRDRDF